MTDKEWLDLALSKMHSGQWFGFKKDYTGNERMAYENIIVHDSSITKPTEAEVNAKIAELKNEETNENLLLFDTSSKFFRSPVDRLSMTVTFSPFSKYFLTR